MSNILKGIKQLNEVNPHNFDSDEDYYAAVRKQNEPQFSGDWDVWDEIASVENELKYTKNPGTVQQLYTKLGKLKRMAGIEDKEDYYGDFDDDGNPIDDMTGTL